VKKRENQNAKTLDYCKKLKVKRVVLPIYMIGSFHSIPFHILSGFLLATLIDL